MKMDIDSSSEKDIVLDATNLSKKRRKNFLKELFRKQNKEFHKKAIVISNRLDSCVSNIKTRKKSGGHDVPIPVVLKFLKAFQPPSMDEGWDSIEVVQQDTYTLDEILDSMDFHQNNKYHTLTCLEHSLRVQRNLYEQCKQEQLAIISDFELVFLGLLHDCGKVLTKTFHNMKLNFSNSAHYYGHENAGAYIALCIDFSQYGVEYEDEDVLELSQLISLHMLESFCNVEDERIKNILIQLRIADRKGK